MHRNNWNEAIAWLRLIRTPSIGPITFHRLIGKFETAEKALDRLPDFARQSGRKAPFKITDKGVAIAEIEALEKISGDLILACDDHYPKCLKAIADYPPVLFVRGHNSLFAKNAIAIIGARNASGVGRKLARTLAADLGSQDFVVVSGLARGIDGAAHEAALPTGTIAVVAGGIDVIYPPEHDALTREIASQGLIMSECPPGQTPTARDFPKRNRLISGLSRGVVVVEAAARSGTLITARFAVEQGREVFAVPGSPLDPRCQGANRLIKQGATLIENADDIIDVLRDQLRGASEHERDLFDWNDSNSPLHVEEPDKLESVKSAILEFLSFTPQHRDEVLRSVEAGPGVIADALLELVLCGDVEEHSGGRFSLSAND